MKINLGIGGKWVMAEDKIQAKAKGQAVGISPSVTVNLTVTDGAMASQEARPSVTLKLRATEGDAGEKRKYNPIVLAAEQGIGLAQAYWIGDKPYFTRQYIGEWLGYRNPQKAVDKIIERNAWIESGRWSTTVRLTAVDEKERLVRVYDPIGMQLIVFESRQAKARNYKVSVAHLVDAYMRGELVPLKDKFGAGAGQAQGSGQAQGQAQAGQAQGSGQAGQAKSLPFQSEEYLVLKELAEMVGNWGRGGVDKVKKLAEELKVCSGTVYRYLRVIKKGEDPSIKHYQPHNKGASILTPEQQEQIIELAYQDITSAEVYRRLGSPKDVHPVTVARFRKKILKGGN